MPGSSYSGFCVLVYLHGLNSAGISGKATTLRESLPSIVVVSPTYPAYLAGEAIAQLIHELSCLCQEKGNAAEPRVLVGSSMGGFYGAWLADRLGFQHLVMINPVLQSWSLLKQVRIGSSHLPHKTKGSSIGSSIEP
ncbi:MAG: hypothetical protein KZQ90_03870 [Candidatus Thiodiazotropha sp. (ex Codakia rugifera)]|nr:hypothetical protein [Candidatus Thiodiazotropha sp. (ex Codakia rugifera)]